MGTKEKIMEVALDLFSVKGFDPVSVRDIASAVGIKESSIYNHFKNKQDIFDTLFEEYTQRGNDFFHLMNITGEDREFHVDERTVNMYRNMGTEQFAQVTGAIFSYYFADPLNVKLRKLLTIEQYRNPSIGKLYREMSFDSSIDFQAQLFGAFMDAGTFVKADPYILALEFFAPIFLLFYKFDNNEENLPRARDLYDRHIAQFTKTYAVSNTEG